MKAECRAEHIFLQRLADNMVYEIVYHQTARRIPRRPVCLRTIHLHVPIYWKMEVSSQRDLRRVVMALNDITADCRSKTVKLTPSDNHFWMMPTPMQDDLPLKTNVMLDLKQLVGLGQKVTVAITVL